MTTDAALATTSTPAVRLRNILASAMVVGLALAGILGSITTVAWVMLGDVALDEDVGRELVARTHFQLRLVTAGEAVHTALHQIQLTARHGPQAVQASFVLRLQRTSQPGQRLTQVTWL